jgi:heme/copper-type cytochrome/quinol oxidase subunit 1
VHSWNFLAGTDILFFLMHFLGAQGIPRRYLDCSGATKLAWQVSSPPPFHTFEARRRALIASFIPILSAAVAFRP